MIGASSLEERHLRYWQESPTQEQPKRILTPSPQEKVEIDKGTAVLRHAGAVRSGIARRSASNRRDTSEHTGFFKSHCFVEQMRGAALAAVKIFKGGMRLAESAARRARDRAICLQGPHLYAGRTTSPSLITTPEFNGHKLYRTFSGMRGA